MKVLINDNKWYQLRANLNKLLLCQDFICRISHFKVITEDVEVKTGFFWKKKEIVKKRFLVELEIEVNHDLEGEPGVFMDNTAIHIVTEHNLFTLRKKFMKMINQLKGFGYELNSKN